MADLSEKEKMLSSQLYDPTDQELTLDRVRARALTHRFNLTDPDALEERQAILGELLGALGANVMIEPPFYCDYGSNIYIEDSVFLNFGCVLLDCADIYIGKGTLLGPNVQLYAADHPRDAATRAAGLELAAPVIIGDQVWIGGGAILLPGVTVGDHSVIGAGSVVTRDIPSGVIAAGNPCRVLRALA